MNPEEGLTPLFSEIRPSLLTGSFAGGCMNCKLQYQIIFNNSDFQTIYQLIF